MVSTKFNNNLFSLPVYQRLIGFLYISKSAFIIRALLILREFCAISQELIRQKSRLFNIPHHNKPYNLNSEQITMVSALSSISVGKLAKTLRMQILDSTQKSEISDETGGCLAW